MSAVFNRFHRWPTTIVVVLVAQVGFGIWMARVAGSDPHYAIEPDYYARAVNWDSTMAQSRRDKALGWHATATMRRTDGPSATLHIQLMDPAGAAITTADTVSADVLAVAHAGRIDRRMLVRDGSGYSATMEAARSGLWEVRIRVIRGADLFTAKLRTELK